MPEKETGTGEPEDTSPRVTITQMKYVERTAEADETTRRARARARADIEARAERYGYHDLRWEVINGAACKLDRLTGKRG